MIARGLRWRGGKPRLRRRKAVSETSHSESVFVFPPDAVGAKFTDTLEIDHEAHRLYMGDNWSGGLDIFDLSGAEPRHVETVRIRGQMFGLCVAKSVSKVYVGLSGSRVAVIDIDENSPKRNTVIETIATGGSGNADLIDFDPVHDKIYIANRNEGFLSAIDAHADKVVAKIDGLGGGLEQPRFNRADGMLYLAGNTDNVLYQIDPERDVLVNTFDIVDACHPNGLAIDPVTNQAFLACSNRERPHGVVWDLTTQSVAAVIEDCGPGDGAAYDASIDRFFFAASGYPSGPVLGVISTKPAELVAKIPTGRGGSWAAYDPSHGVVYTPAVVEGRPALRATRLG